MFFLVVNFRLHSVRSCRSGPAALVRLCFFITPSTRTCPLHSSHNSLCALRKTSGMSEFLSIRRGFTGTNGTASQVKEQFSNSVMILSHAVDHLWNVWLSVTLTSFLDKEWCLNEGAALLNLPLMCQIIFYFLPLFLPMSLYVCSCVCTVGKISY